MNSTKAGFSQARLPECFKGCGEILTNNTGGKIIFYSAIRVADTCHCAIATNFLNMGFRSLGHIPVFPDGEWGFSSHHIVARTFEQLPELILPVMHVRYRALITS